LLRPSEALVLHAAAGGSGLVTTCITSTGWTFHVKALDKLALQQFVMDEKLLSAAVRGTHRPSVALDTSFPTDASHRLYQTLLGGIEQCLRDKSHILLATDPDFFSLPWNALLAKPASDDREFRHRDAAWLPKSYALSLLPSVRSLHQLRATLPPSRAKRKFLGVGDPDFKGAPDRSIELALAPLFVSRGVANREAIAALPRLPDSAEELRVIAEALGSSNSDILLGRDASERSLRKRPLNDYRVISFATHAVVAGEIDGTTEPALVLSPGDDEKNDKNDGLLTATEIANLALDANLVILSACNTAASDGRTSGRGLSGLADAFFFAGARALAVTQWAVFSDAAKQLGAGLVSRPLRSPGAGVAEGLRQTMVDYIAAAKEDYLAHPRFWAAFMIAGDGAVKPAGGTAAVGDDHRLIKLEWEHVNPNSADAEFMGLATNARSLYAMGIQSPPAGGRRAGSYFARVQVGKNVEVIRRDGEIGASSIVAIDNEIGLLGYVPAETKSSAVFRLLDRDGTERWRHVVDGKLWNFPVSVLSSAGGFILVSIENDFSSSPAPSTLVLTLVTDQGTIERQRRFSIPLKGASSSPKHVLRDPNGNLIIAIAGTLFERPAGQPAVWTNPRTGSKKSCLGQDGTHLLAFDPRTFDVQSARTVYEGRVAALRQLDGRLYAAFKVNTNCRLEKNVRLAEVGAGFELKTIFQASNINSMEVNDFAATKDGFVLVGTTLTFLPTALTREVLNIEEFAKSNLWDESIWERGEEHRSAFVLVLGKDGAVVGDRVFPDVRNRSISNVVADKSGRFIAVGSAFGDRGWAIAFSLRQAGLDGPKGFPSWLKWLLGPFGRAN
jgi:CHAT domain-containing protein